MEHFTPHFRRDPNAKVDSVYYGVAPGARLVTSVIKKHPVEDRMETTRAYGPGMPRGQGGQVGVFILGGMETTLDEMEYLLQRQKEKMAAPFVPQRSGKEIADMCRVLMERRNDRVKYFKVNPSEKPKKRPVRLHLPVGVRWMPTPVPGFQIAARI